ncbi:MAG: hypothetical protein ACK5LC_07160 [Coprobacillaceae bacterium]
MKNIGILFMELVVTLIIVIAGISGKKVLFIDGPRSAIITLGIIGIFFCMISVGKFINAAPAHPLTILGYIFGIIALAIFVVQTFQWNLPLINDPKNALYILSACIIIKAIIGRFEYLIQ